MRRWRQRGPLRRRQGNGRRNASGSGHFHYSNRGHNSYGALHPLKMSSPSLTSSSEHTVLMDLCWRHGSYACASGANEVLSAAARVMANETPPGVAVSAILTEDITRLNQVTMQGPYTLPFLSGFQRNLRERPRASHLVLLQRPSPPRDMGPHLQVIQTRTPVG